MKKTAVYVLILLALSFLVVSVLQPSPLEAAKPASDPVKNHVGNLILFSPVEYRNLTVIPVKGPVSSSTKFLTLDEAIKKDYLVVKEVSESGSVNNLAIWNNSNNYVFIMSGEILAGSKQDRVLQKDVLLPPDSGKVVIDVFCVEHGRWTYKSDKFYSESKTANLSVRQSAKVAKNQSEVWDKVGETNRSVAAAAPTDSLSKASEAPVVKEKKESYSGKFLNIPDKYPTANGVIVLVNDKVMVADLFSDQRLFERLWPKLVDSYVIEAISREGKSVSSDISSARKFLEEIRQADIDYRETPGVGRSVEVESKAVSGSGLVKDVSIVHLDVFPRYKTTERQPAPQIRRNYNNTNNIEQNQINAPNQLPSQQ